MGAKAQSLRDYVSCATVRSDTRVLGRRAMPKYNPFRPNSIVTPGMFRGRYDEMRRIEQALFQTKNLNPHHFMIEGERGIAKAIYTSLILNVSRPIAASDARKK